MAVKIFAGVGGSVIPTPLISVFYRVEGKYKVMYREGEQIVVEPYPHWQAVVKWMVPLFVPPIQAPDEDAVRRLLMEPWVISKGMDKISGLFIAELAPNAPKEFVKVPYKKEDFINEEDYKILIENTKHLLGPFI